MKAIFSRKIEYRPEFDRILHWKGLPPRKYGLDDGWFSAILTLDWPEAWGLRLET